MLCLRILCGCLLSLPQFAYAVKPPITALAFDPQETSVLAGSQLGLKQYSWPALKPIKSFPTQLEQIHDMAFSPDGKILAIAGGTPSEKGILELRTWPGFKKLKALVLHADLIHALAWSSDSQTIYTAGHDGEVLKLSASSGTLEQRFTGHSQPVRALALLPDQQTLISAGHDQTIRVWNTHTGKLSRVLDNHTKPIRDLAVRPSEDEKALPMIASIGADRTIRIWQPTIGRLVRFLRLESAIPLAVVWSPDGELLFVTDDAGQVRIIEPDTLTAHSTIETKIDQPYSFVVSKDGQQLVIGGANGKLIHLDITKSQTVD